MSKNRQLKHLLFIGFMGTGKSTLGAYFATKNHLPFVDLDHMIEQTEGSRIPEIFSEKGETYFRALESRCLRELLTSSNESIVLATGGGVVLDKGNIEVLLQNGYIVQTTAAFEEMIQRLQNAGNQRPLLIGNLEERVRSLMEARKGLYDFADLEVSTDQLGLEKAANYILTKWEEARRGI